MIKEYIVRLALHLSAELKNYRSIDDCDDWFIIVAFFQGKVISNLVSTVPKS